MNDRPRHQCRFRGDEAGAGRHPTVRDWLDEQVAETLFVSSVTVAELLFSIGALPDGRRRHKLTQTLDGLLCLFDGRVLPFDTAAARHYPYLAVAARNTGKGFPTPDGYIAAIAIAQGFAVATRGTSAFNAAGVPIIDPWRARR